MKKVCSAILFILVMGSGVFGFDSPETLTFASIDNIPPYVYVEEGKLTGVSIDIINELARRGGFSVKIEIFPWARVLLEVEQGRVDGAFSAYMKEERKAYSLYTGIIHYDELRVAVKKGKEFPFSGIESLYGKTVGKGRGVYAGDAFDSAVGKGKIFLFDVDDMNMSNIRKLHEGRLDAVIGSPVAMQHYARELGYKDIVLLPGALREKIPAYLILSKHSGLKHKKRWQQKLTNLINEMHADGTIHAIYQRYHIEMY